MLGFPGRLCSGQPSSVTQKIKTVTSGSRTTETFTAVPVGTRAAAEVPCSWVPS